jgi:SdpC family antimicrobial peptide
MLMILSMLAVSCSQYTGVSSPMAATARYSGEQIFQGLFFFQNEIADQVTQLKEVSAKINQARANDPEVDKYLNGLAAMTTDYINTNYPTFFADLQTTMYSGDYYRMEQAMKQSTQMIEQAILTSDEYSSIYAVGKKVGQDPKLMAEVQALDLTTAEGAKQLELLLANVEGIEQVDSKAVGLVAVVAGFYLLAAAVNTVVAAYYVIAAAAVVTKLAIWDVMEANRTDDGLTDEQLVAELGDLFHVE